MNQVATRQFNKEYAKEYVICLALVVTIFFGLGMLVILCVTILACRFVITNGTQVQRSTKRFFAEWGGALLALVCAVSVTGGTLIGIVWFVAQMVNSSNLLRNPPPGLLE